MTADEAALIVEAWVGAWWHIIVSRIKVKRIDVECVIVWCALQSGEQGTCNENDIGDEEKEEGDDDHNENVDDDFTIVMMVMIRRQLLQQNVRNNNNSPK